MAKSWNTQPTRHATQKQARRNTHNQRKSGLSFTVDVRLESQVSGLSLSCVCIGRTPFHLLSAPRSSAPPEVPVYHFSTISISKFPFSFLSYSKSRHSCSHLWFLFCFILTIVSRKPPVFSPCIPTCLVIFSLHSSVYSNLSLLSPSLHPLRSF